MEGFGEDVLLTSNMGAAMCRGLQDNGVIATPKHFADNYSHGT
jgi:beta-glucosidase